VGKYIFHTELGAQAGRELFVGRKLFAVKKVKKKKTFIAFSFLFFSESSFKLWVFLLLFLFQKISIALKTIKKNGSKERDISHVIGS
jgi:hypothetical protein